jgi:toxin ParE1/3/4
MNPVIIKKPSAKQDVLQHYEYICQRNSDAADRFLDAFDQALFLLSQFPLMGHLWESSLARLANIRTWGVPKFRNYRIFYHPLENGIEVIHVFHGKQDIRKIMESEGPEE